MRGLAKWSAPHFARKPPLCRSRVRSSRADLGEAFCFVSRLLRVVYAAGSKKTAKKHTEHERVKFWVPLNTRGGLTRTPHGALKCTKARTTLKRRYTLYQDVQTRDLAPYSREHDRNPLPFRVPLVFSMFF